MIWDLAIVGGGPAGLAAATRAAEAGFRAVVLERASGPADKACGEGLMPAAVRELDSLGALSLLADEERMPFRGIRYMQEDGTCAEARFRDGEGLGIRRTALSRALQRRARAAGAELRTASVRGAQVDRERVRIELEQGDGLEARLLVAADGLNSPLRRAAGLELPASRRSFGIGRPPRRFGMRRHYRLRPWTDFVEVHWASGVEAYVTPVGPECVNVALLWDAAGEEASFDSLLDRFPRLRACVASAAVASEARGAGPLYRPVRARAGHRIAFVGDAAGYVDAITGQGLSLAFAAATSLIRALPRDLAAAGLAGALRRYQASLRRPWLRYAVPAHALVALSRRPALREKSLRLLARHPRLFATLLRAVQES